MGLQVYILEHLNIEDMSDVVLLKISKNIYSIDPRVSEPHLSKCSNYLETANFTVSGYRLSIAGKGRQF